MLDSDADGYPNTNDKLETTPCIIADRGSRLDPSENQRSTRPRTRPGIESGAIMTETNEGMERGWSVIGERIDNRHQIPHH